MARHRLKNQVALVDYLKQPVSLLNAMAQPTFFYIVILGLRTIGALPVGLKAISWRRFSVLNGCSALLWVIVLVGGGYIFGATFDALSVENLTALSLLLLCVFLVTLYRLWNKTAEVKTL